MRARGAFDAARLFDIVPAAGHTTWLPFGASGVFAALPFAMWFYAIVLYSFIKLRLERPDMPRPYKSPFGIPGAVIGLLLSLIALAATFAVESYRPAVWGVAAFVALALIYYALYSRHRLVANAPEEAVALGEGS